MRNLESEPCICRPCKGRGGCSQKGQGIRWYLPPLQGEGEGLFANEEFARANKQNISQRQSASETVGQFRKKYTYLAKTRIISTFFLQLSAKKNNKDYIKTLDTEQNADYTIMDWVYWLFNASLSKYHQEEKT